MLLAIDIGNTNISFGIFNGKRLLRRFIAPTGSVKALVSSTRAIRRYKIKHAVICSVVPAATKRLALTVLKAGSRPYIIGKQIKVPIKNFYRNPAQVGQDRLVNAFAGIKFYKAPIVVVDFGTAVTFDCISKDNKYLGGLILPGLNLSLEALYNRTALLPKIKLAKPKDLIGRSTRESMLSGLVYGFACLTDDLIARLKKELGKNTYVFATGGDAKLVSKYCRFINRQDPDLTLKGIRLVYESEKKS